ncbi:hypothetical protein pb186bvf_001590 [Paramecium bursaria]
MKFFQFQGNNLYIKFPKKLINKYQLRDILHLKIQSQYNIIYKVMYHSKDQKKYIILLNFLIIPIIFMPRRDYEVLGRLRIRKKSQRI